MTEGKVPNVARRRSRSVTGYDNQAERDRLAEVDRQARELQQTEQISKAKSARSRANKERWAKMNPAERAAWSRSSDRD